MVIVEGSAAQTVRVYEGLLTAACGPSPQDAALRARIEESAARIARWKVDRREPLRRVVDVPPSAVQALIQALPPDDADLATFRFDPAAIARLVPSLEAAALSR